MIRSRRGKVARLAVAAAFTLTLGTAALAEQASPATGKQTSQETTPRPPEILAVETAIRKSDFDLARKKAIVLIDGDFARRDFKAAAYAAYLLAQADMYAGELGRTFTTR